MNYTLIGTKTTRSFRVLWALEELGLTYTHLPERPHSDTVRGHNLPGKRRFLGVAQLCLLQRPVFNLEHVVIRDGSKPPDAFGSRNHCNIVFIEVGCLISCLCGTSDRKEAEPRDQ